MTLRTRLRRWLGIEQNDADLQRHTFELQDLLKKDVSLQNQVDGLSTSLNNTSKGHRELIDDALKACIALRKDLGSSAADNVAMYEAAKKEDLRIGTLMRSLIDDSTAHIAKLSERLGSAETSIKFGATFWSDQAKINEETLAKLNEFTEVYRRLVALETASKSLGAHLALIADNATAAERARCALRIETAALPHFRREHRDKLATLIRSGK